MPAGEFSFDITPQDAIDYLSKRQKTELSWHWSDVQKQEHMRAFTVAKMTSATLLDDVRKSLDKAMAEGQSFQEWRKDIIPKLQGVWLGKTYGELWDGMTPAEQAGKTPPTPEERDRVIKASRLETIFRTNMFNAYAAGRYRQLKEDADIYPYWRYVTAKDSAVRPAHRALEGKVFKADDPFWSTHYPPNGFNCRCIVEAVDEYDLEMQDLKVQEGGNVYFDEESGQTVYRDAEGKEYPCDKGWDYNVGEDPTGKKTLASKKFPPELTKAIREDLKAEAERLKAEAKELEKARKQAEEESRRADAAQKAAEQAKKQAEAEAKRKAEEQRKAQAEAERKAKEQSQKVETEPKRFVVDVTRPSKPSKHPAKKAAADEQKRFVVDVTRPNKPSKRAAKKATTNEQKRFVVDVTRPDKPSKRAAKKAAAGNITKSLFESGDKRTPMTEEEHERHVYEVTREYPLPQWLGNGNSIPIPAILDHIKDFTVEVGAIVHKSFYPKQEDIVLASAIGAYDGVNVIKILAQKYNIAPDDTQKLHAFTFGKVFIHNHPGEAFGLSPKDLSTAIELRFSEIISVTESGYVLSFRPDYSKIGAKEMKALCAIPNKIEKEVSDWGLEKLIGKDGAENIFDREKARLYIERLSQYGTCSFYTI